MISVCIATYNGADVIKTQLQSILPQLGEDDEIIVSDDSSKDDTRKIIEDLNDSRIHLIDGPALGSPIPNFENALQYAKGDYIFLSDQDDKWMPGKLNDSIAVLKSGYDCVVTDCVVTDKDLNVTSSSFFTLNGTKEGCWYNLLVKNGYLGGCMAFTKRVKEKSLPFPKNIPMHDIWIGNVAAFYYNVSFLHKSCSYFRRSGHNVSTSASKSTNSLLTKFTIRLKVIKDLIRII